MASTNNDSTPPVSTSNVLTSFKNFHKLYFQKLRLMRDVKTIIYFVDDATSNDFALAELLKTPLSDAEENSESFDTLCNLISEVVDHVSEGFLAVIADVYGSQYPDLVQLLPEPVIDVKTLNDVFREDIDGVGLLIYNLVLASVETNQILFSNASLSQLQRVIVAIGNVQSFDDSFLASHTFPTLDVTPTEETATFTELRDSEEDEFTEPEEIEEIDERPAAHKEFIEKLFKAFDAIEVLEGFVDFAELKAEIPSDLVVDDVLWERCIRVIKVLTPPNDDQKDPQTEALVDLLEAIFNRISDYNAALTTYWQSCHDATGPLAFCRFNIRRGLLHFERSMGSHNQTSDDEIKPLVSLFAWLLIGDTRATLTSLMKQLIPNEQLVHFFRKTVRFLPVVCTFETVKGFNLILLVLSDIVAEMHSRGHTSSMDMASRLLTKLSQDFKDNTPGLIPPTPLFDFAVRQTFVESAPVAFWFRVATKLVDGAYARRPIVINWDPTSKLPHNPLVFAIFMLKMSGLKAYNENIGETIKKVMQTLSKIIASNPNLQIAGEALDAVDDVNWATKIAAIQWLNISNYKPQIPASIYCVLSEENKANYRELRDVPPSLMAFLMSIFELGFVGGDVPDIFLQDISKMYALTEADTLVAAALTYTLKNVVKHGVKVVDSKMLEIIHKVVNALDCKFFAPLIETWTPETFKVLANLQSIRFVALAFRIAAEDCLSISTDVEAKIKASEMPPEARLLLTTFCTTAYKRVTELRDALKKTKDHFARVPKVIEGNSFSLMAYINAVTTLFVDTLTVSFLLDAPTEELIALLRELRAAKKSVDDKMFETSRQFVPNDEKSKSRHGRNSNNKKKNHSKDEETNGVDRADGDAASIPNENVNVETPPDTTVNKVSEAPLDAEAPITGPFGDRFLRGNGDRFPRGNGSRRSGGGNWKKHYNNRNTVAQN